MRAADFFAVAFFAVVVLPDDHNKGRAMVTIDHGLTSLYKTIQNTIEALDGDFQVIVMEHADLDDEPFRSSVEARWRRSNDQALVPQDWITEEIDDA
ncbi:DUF3732 domain-containing protein [Streptomyces sp. NPDC054813]